MEQLQKFVIDGMAKEAVGRVHSLLAEGAKPKDILEKALIPGMDEVGELFQQGEFFLPELLVAARAMQEAVAVLKPLLIQGGVESVGKIVVGTVKGDMHDIGKSLVAITFEGAGFEVIDLGVDVPPETFVDAIVEHQPVAVGLSALLTITMEQMDGVMQAISNAGLRDKVKVLVGGAAVTQAYADEIGADFYGLDPTSAKNFVQNCLKA